MRSYFAFLQILLVSVSLLFHGHGAYAQDVSLISVLSNIDGATVFIDGENTGLTTPMEPLKVDSGSHFLKVEKDGYTTMRKEFFLSPGESMVFNAILLPLDVTDKQKETFEEMGKKPITKRWWFWLLVLAALGAAAGGGGGGGGGGPVASDTGSIEIVH